MVIVPSWQDKQVSELGPGKPIGNPTVNPTIERGPPAKPIPPPIAPPKAAPIPLNAALPTGSPDKRLAKTVNSGPIIGIFPKVALIPASPALPNFCNKNLPSAY